MYLKLAYLAGAADALQKLGTVAGTIVHKSRSSQDNPSFDYTADKRQGLWAEFNQHPITTGEESSLGMPSAGGVNKSAAAGGSYAGHDGAYGQGGIDSTETAPQEVQDQYRSSAMAEAFKANDDYDKSYAPESSLTQPHGNLMSGGQGKVAMSGTTMGAGAGLSSGSGSGMAAPGAAIDPSKPPKAVAPPKPIKPPSMPGQQQLAAATPHMNMAANFASPQKRLLGSVV